SSRSARLRLVVDPCERRPRLAESIATVTEHEQELSASGAVVGEPHRHRVQGTGRRYRAGMSAVAPQLVVTSGTFSIDGEDFDVDNNIWIVGDDEECLVVDAAHEAQPIIDAVGGRR